MEYTRKKLADALGIGIEALRHYEKQGIISSPKRNSNGYRIYTDKDFHKIKHILVAKQYGFSINEIKNIFNIAEKTEFENIEDIMPFLYNKLQDIDKQIADLNNLKNLLQNLIQTLK